MAFERRKSKEVRIGNLTIGGNSPIAVQSMLNIPAHDIEGSVKQAKALEKAGCQIIRAAIPDMDAVKLIPALKEAVKVPIVADIHFDYRLALESISAGVDKIRIKPGNIGSKDRVKAVDGLRQERDSDKSRRQQRLYREGYSRQIRRSHRTGSCGQRNGTCAPA